VCWPLSGDITPLSKPLLNRGLKLRYSLEKSSQRGFNLLGEVESKAKGGLPKRAQKYHYLAVCVYQLMELGEGGGCWGGKVTVFV
jgi:hypothetical protein